MKTPLTLQQFAALGLTIPAFRTGPSITGIGWVSVSKWNAATGSYKHLTSFRSQEEADSFIKEISPTA